MTSIKNLRALERIKECKEMKLFSLNLDNLVEQNKLPIEILSLTELKYLSIKSSRLTKVPSEVFKLKNLERLDISRNEIEELSEDFSGLEKLMILKANHNKITLLSSKISECKNLTTIYLSQNNIKSIPETFTNLKNLKILELRNNPYISSPPLEIANRDVGAIFNYLSMLSINKLSVNNYEAKIILVGEGNVGKTSLKERIISNIYESKTDSTHGIEISNWLTSIDNIDEFKVNVWDFGGQEIYHSTHQYFLTKRALYLFIWNARTDDDIHIFEKWLNTINGLSNNSPIIIIQNKIDERKKNVNEFLIKGEFPNIIGFYDVSSKTGEGVSQLTRVIKSNISKLEHIESKLPEVWIDIRTELEESEMNFLSLNEYQKICKKHKLSDKNIEYLSDYFHDLGVFLHFRDNIILNQYVFINPMWATNSVYSIIDNTDVIDSYGAFDYNTLEKSWKNYPKSIYPTLLELMLRFELCFKYENENKFIIPSLLPENPPEKIQWSYENNLKFVFEYKHSISNIISRFIVKSNDLIKDNLFWKYGVVITNENSQSWINFNPFEKNITINIKGVEKRTFLQIIRREFNKIHKSLNIKPKELVPCICNHCENSKDFYFWDFNVLNQAKLKNIKKILCQKGFEEVSVVELLSGIKSNEKDAELEIISLLKGIRATVQDDERFVEKANKVISLKPNFFGLGIDFNELIKRMINK